MRNSWHATPMHRCSIGLLLPRDSMFTERSAESVIARRAVDRPRYAFELKSVRNCNSVHSFLSQPRSLLRDLYESELQPTILTCKFTSSPPLKHGQAFICSEGNIFKRSMAEHSFGVTCRWILELLGQGRSSLV